MIVMGVRHHNALDIGQSVTEAFESRFKRGPTAWAVDSGIDQGEWIPFDQIHLNRLEAPGAGDVSGCKRQLDLMYLRAFRNRIANHGAGSRTRP